MSFAIPLIEDLKKKRVRFRNCGYFSRANFPENFILRVLQSGDSFDLNIRFGTDYPISKAEFECKKVEIEVQEGIRGIYSHDFDVLISGNLSVLVKYFPEYGIKKEDMKNLREYIKSLGYKSVRFRRAY
jgi:hypothetical protein